MAKYSDLVKVREQKAAYNIETEMKGDWESFIPYTQFNEILSMVITSVRNKDVSLHKSFWIQGTYGTGKSHAAAVIKHLLCDPVEEIREYLDANYTGTDKVLADQLLKLRETKRLVPITLYGVQNIAHREDLAPRLQQAVMEGLRLAGVNVSVKTDFDVYCDHIESHTEFWDMLITKNHKLHSYFPTRQKLLTSLQGGDISTLTLVRDALREDRYDIVIDTTKIRQWLMEVQQAVAEEPSNDYVGLLIIWDEFTDVMSSEYGLSVLKALQEIDESLMNPENNSYFLYVSHPSAFNSLDREQFSQTSGRYHIFKYAMETVSAFHIMNSKMMVQRGKEEDYMCMMKDWSRPNMGLYEKYAQGSSDKDETIDDLQRLFPLHPATANLAAYYAREAGSSSRSVFQFLGENPAIREFLDDPDNYDKRRTITADYLWDYVLDDFSGNIQKYGAVVERFNSYRNHIEAQGEDYFRVFKSILLLNALNNLTGGKDNETTVTPSEQNIRDLFEGTQIEERLGEILDFVDSNSIITRLPGDLFSIQFSALPRQEIEQITKELTSMTFKFTSQVVNFGSLIQDELAKHVTNVSREHVVRVFGMEANEYTLTQHVQRSYNEAKPWETFIAVFLARNLNERNQLREWLANWTEQEEYNNIALLLCDKVLGDKEYDRFIEYQANATCAQRHGYSDQQETHTKYAKDLLKTWITDIKKGNFTYFLRGKEDMASCMKMTTTINMCVSPVIFNYGPESLEIILNRTSKTYWKKAVMKEVVKNVLMFNTKKELESKCTGPNALMAMLLQDSVDANLKWKDDVSSDHPLLKVTQFVKSKFDHTEKAQSFNLAEKLKDLTKPPYGVYPSAAGMGMVAFAMRNWIGKIFDLNGKPREQQHLIDDISSMFKAWDEGKGNNKLEFRFETKESRDLTNALIKLFGLKDSKIYKDVSSLTDARWAIIHAFSESKKYPMWSLKYCKSCNPTELGTVIDDLLKLCKESDSRNPALINSVLNGIEEYDFELPDLINSENNYKEGFAKFAMGVESVGLKQDELDGLLEYLKQHMQESVGLWEEDEVKDKMKDWRLKQQAKTAPSPTEVYVKPQPQFDVREPEKPYQTTKFDDEISIAKTKIDSIESLEDAKKILRKLCDLGYDVILNMINQQ